MRLLSWTRLKLAAASSCCVHNYEHGRNPLRVRGVRPPQLCLPFSFVLHRSFSEKEEVDIAEIGRLYSVIRRPFWSPSLPLSYLLRHARLPRFTPAHLSSLLQLASDDDSDDPSLALRIYLWAISLKSFPFTVVGAVPAARELVIHRWEPTEPLIRSFLALVEHLTAPGSRNPPNSPLQCSLLIKGYGWAGMPDSAIWVFEHMSTPPQISHYNNLFYALAKARRPAAVERFHAEMTGRGLLPDSNSFAIRMRAFCWARQGAEAYKLFIAMLKQGLFPDLPTFGLLVDVLCQSGYINKAAYVVLYKMQREGFILPLSYFHTVVYGLCWNGHARDAHKLVYRVTKKGFTPEASVFEMLLTGFCLVKDLHNAVLVAEDMVMRRSLFPDVPILNNLLACLLQQGKSSQALQLLHKFMAKGAMASAPAFETVIAGLCQCGDSDKAFEIWSTVRESGIPSSRSEALLLDQLCRNGSLDNAKTLLKKIVDDGQGLPPDLSARILTTFSVAGRLEEIDYLMQFASHA